MVSEELKRTEEQMAMSAVLSKIAPTFDKIVDLIESANGSPDFGVIVSSCVLRQFLDERVGDSTPAIEILRRAVIDFQEQTSTACDDSRVTLKERNQAR